MYFLSSRTLPWRHNDHDGVANHQPHGCLLYRLFGRRSKKTSKLRVNERWIPRTKASDAENVSIWWRHEIHDTLFEIYLRLVPKGITNNAEHVMIGSGNGVARKK